MRNLVNKRAKRFNCSGLIRLKTSKIKFLVINFLFRKYLISPIQIKLCEEQEEDEAAEAAAVLYKDPVTQQ